MPNTPDGTKVVSQHHAILIAKVCHNLLVSTAPPDVQTFNTLFVELNRWKRPDLCDVAIAAFKECFIRPNELSCAAILDYYISAGRPDEFIDFVACMRGVPSRKFGHLMLAHPLLQINHYNESRLLRLDERTLVQKVYPTPLVFEVLIRGVAAFAGPRRAIEVYLEMKTDGWGLGIKGLTNLLKACTIHSDWSTGRLVWNEVQQLQQTTPLWLGRDTYASMLSLCHKAKRRDMFFAVLSDARNYGYREEQMIPMALELAHIDTEPACLPNDASETADGPTSLLTESIGNSIVHEVTGLLAESGAPSSL